MELEQMKSLWQAQEQTKNEIQKINENLVRRIINDKSHSALEKIKNTEYLMAAGCLLLLTVFLLMIKNVGTKPEMIVSYAIIIVAILLSLVWYLFKINYLSKINFSNGNIVDTAKKIARFRLFIIKEKLWSFVSLIIVVPAAYTLNFQWIQHKSVFEHQAFSITEMIIALALGIIISLFIYRRYYFNHIHAIIDNLKEIEAFEKEG